jgi:hypothetical protein
MVGALGSGACHIRTPTAWFAGRPRRRPPGSSPTAPPEDAAWAASRLRGQAWTITREVSPLDAWPTVPATYILGIEDPVINPTWSRRVVPELLGVAPVELPGGHSPFPAAPRRWPTC